MREVEKWHPLGVENDRADIVKRLKQVAIWSELPLAEVRNECRTRRLPFASSDERAVLVKRLATACWGGPAEPRPSQCHGKRRFAPQDRPYHNMPSEITKHFTTLQIPVTSTAAEVGKAFRKLALRLHPDKAVGAHQAHDNSEFREVAEAYEALREYLKRPEH